MPTKVVRPFLWRIEGETPNYLFGTAHIADKRVLELHPVAKKAFDDADEALFEIDFDKASSQQKAIALPPGEKLEDTLPAELIAQIYKRLQKLIPQVPPQAIRSQLRARAVVWPLLLPQLEAQIRFPGAVPLDMKLHADAKAAGKEVGGLEDPTAQLTDLFKLSKEEVREFVRASLAAMEKADQSKEDQITKTIGYYLRGDGDAFLEYFLEDLHAGGLSESVADKVLGALLYARNKRIADAIAKHIKDHPDKRHFFAVGTAHMLGDKSLLKYLEAQGIKVRRVAE